MRDERKEQAKDAHGYTSMDGSIVFLSVFIRVHLWLTIRLPPALGYVIGR
jgi:hypothetical protein